MKHPLATLAAALLVCTHNGGAKFLGRNLPLRGEKQLLLEGGIRVPLILRWPGVFPVGETCATPVIAMDLTATIAAAAGARARDKQPFDGIDLTPALTVRNQPAAERPIYFRRRTISVPESQNDIRQSAVRQGDWKLLRTYKPMGGDRYQTALYQLRDDIGEMRDLAAKHPERVKAMQELLDDWETQTAETAELFPHPRTRPHPQ